MGLFELVIALLSPGRCSRSGPTGWAFRTRRCSRWWERRIALVPGAPTVKLDPELALVLFVAPTLLDAAYDASPRDLQAESRRYLGLAVVLVLLTVVTVGWVARLVMPDLGWAAALALGAIVAPPDASAATAVLRKLRPPHRLMVILEGESLFNDATALLIYRVAVGAAMTGAFSGWKMVPLLLVTCGGGVLLGWVLARLFIVAFTRLKDIPVSVLLQFVSTFAVWIIADRLKLSAIITMVVYAMTIAQRVGGRMNARYRIASYAVWDVAVLVLNVLAFVLIGLQLRGIVSRVQGPAWRTYALCAVAVCLTVIVVRIAWVMTYGALLARRRRRRPPTPGKPPPTVGSGILASWCGMRGIVTLAAALALPEGSPGIPAPGPDHLLGILRGADDAGGAGAHAPAAAAPPLSATRTGRWSARSGIARAETSRAALRALEQPR